MTNAQTKWTPTRPDTVLHALARAVEAAPDVPFLRFSGGEEYTFRDLDRLTTAMAHALAAAGIGGGDRVVTVLDTSADSIICWFAINKLGAIWVPINTAYHGEFLRHQIADSGAKLVIVDGDYLPRIVEIAARIPEVSLVLCRGPSLPDTAACPIPVERLDKYRNGGDTPIPLAARPGDMAALMYTSGTTGPSKGCMVSHNYICNCGIHSVEALPPAPGDVLWTCMPLFHLGAVGIALMPALLTQTTAAFSARFSVSGFWAQIEESGATLALLAASMAPLLAHAAENDAMRRCFGKLRMIQVAPIAPDIKRIWYDRFGIGFINSYGFGQTEGNRLVTHRHGDPLPPDASSGLPSPDFEIMIVDDEDRPMPPGQTGEVVFRPKRPNIMFGGYWNQPQATVDAWRNLWMHTGDLGRIDERGFFYFIDRKKDSLRTRGENISSFEVESVFVTHPAISEAAVHTVGLDGSAEDEIKVTAVLAEGAELDAETLCRWCIEKLPYFAVPRFFEFRAELVKNPTGRVLKNRLRDEGCTPATWDRKAAGIEVRRR